MCSCRSRRTSRIPFGPAGPEYDWYRARALLENTAAGAGTTQDNPAYVPYDQIRSMSYSLDGILYLPPAAGGSPILDTNGNPSPSS